MEYVSKYYADQPVHEVFATPSDTTPNVSYMLPHIQKSAIPEGLFVLQSIVCHIGVIDAGHYFTLSNDMSLDENEQIKLSLFEFNDDDAKELPNPRQELDTISGKVSKPEQQNEESSTSRSGIAKSAGFGETGYMYFYQNVAQWAASQGMKKFDVSETLQQHFV